MKIENQPRDDHQVKIIVELDDAEYSPYLQQAARKIAREAKVPGFRPGKAPFDIIKRTFGMELIEKQAIEIAVDKIYPQMLEESKVQPGGPGILEDVSDTHPPVFSFIVPLEPEVTLGDYLSIRQEYLLEPITDKDVEDTITNLQKEYATAEPVERPAEVDDLVAVKISAKRLNPAEGESEDLVKEIPHQFHIELEPAYEVWPFKGFSKELVGCKSNEEKIIQHSFTEDTPYDNLKGKEVEFHVTVQNVKSLVLPELDDEFAKSLGNMETMEELRNDIRKHLEEHKQKEYDQEYTSKLLEEIVAKSTIKYPPTVLEEEIKDVLQSIEQDLADQRMDMDTYLKVRKLEKEAFIASEVKPVAVKRLERSLVMQKIAETEKIEINREELEKNVTSSLIELFSTPGFEKPKTMKSKQDLTTLVSFRTANRMMNDKIAERLKQIASGENQVEPSTETTEESATVAEVEKAPKKRKSKKSETVEEE